MAEFRTKKIRETDAKGRLIAAGIEWTERRLIVRWFFGPIAMGAAMLGVMALIGSALGPPVAWLGSFAAFCALVFIAAVFIISACGSVTRAVIFHIDGTTTAPYGLSRYRGVRKFRNDQSEFVSIEASVEPVQSYVLLYTREGDAYVLAMGLEAWQARKLAVQLSTVLQDVRDTAAHLHRNGEAPRGRAKRAQRVID